MLGQISQSLKQKYRHIAESMKDEVEPVGASKQSRGTSEISGPMFDKRQHFANQKLPSQITTPMANPLGL